MCTDSHKTKERQKATSVDSTRRSPWKAQPFPSTAEIDSIVPGITTMLSVGAGKNKVKRSTVKNIYVRINQIL